MSPLSRIYDNTSLILRWLLIIVPISVVVGSVVAGLHGMCEKHLAPTAELSRKMLARAEAAGVVHMPTSPTDGCPTCST